MKKLILVAVFILSNSLSAGLAKAKKPRPCPKGTECKKGWNCDKEQKVCLRIPKTRIK